VGNVDYITRNVLFHWAFFHKKISGRPVSWPSVLSTQMQFESAVNETLCIRPTPLNEKRSFHTYYITDIYYIRSAHTFVFVARHSKSQFVNMHIGTRFVFVPWKYRCNVHTRSVRQIQCWINWCLPTRIHTFAKFNYFQVCFEINTHDIVIKTTRQKLVVDVRVKVWDNGGAAVAQR
jgi:hypothetical protein